jgi:hypothetical protein
VDSLAGPWLAAIGIVTWREVKASSHMPVPAALLGVTGLFLGLSLFADVVPAARRAVTLLGWGLDLAGLLQILPNGLFGQGLLSQVQTAQATEAAAETPASSGGKTG